MGEVHEAIDIRNGRRVALKMLFEIDPASVYRLKRDFRRMVDISHVNLVALHERLRPLPCARQPRLPRPRLLA